jgi:hypothetical protein
MSKLDDVLWNLNGDNFAKGVPEENAATHMRSFVAWAINRGLRGRFLPAASSPAIEAVAQGRRQSASLSCMGVTGSC